MEENKVTEAEIAEAEALSLLEGNAGWDVMKKWIHGAIETTKDQLASSKHNDNWEKTIRLQAKYDAYTTLLFLKERRIKRVQDFRNKTSQKDGD